MDAAVDTLARAAHELLAAALAASPAATCVLDGAGVVLAWNPAAERLTGLLAADVVGGPAPVAEGEAPGLRSALAVVRRGESARHQARWRRRGGATIALAAEVVPARGPGGEVIAALVTLVMADPRDMSIEACLERHVPESELQAAIAAAPEAVATFDREGRIVDTWNPAAERLFGWTRDEVLGRPAPHLRDLTEFRHLSVPVFAEARRAQFEVEAQRRDGRPVWLSVAAAPLLGPDGAVTRLLGVARDVTAGREAEEFLRRTGRMAKVGGWEIDLRTMQPRWSEEVYRIHDVPIGDPIDLEGAIDYYAPEARPLLTESIRRAVEEGVCYELELPFITRLGRRLWVRTHGVPEFADGRCVRLTGTFQDITELRHAQIERDRLFEEHRMLALVAQHTTNGVALIRRDGRFEWINAGFERMTGYTMRDLQELGDQTPLWGPETDLAAAKALAERVREGVGSRAELLHYRKDGSSYWAELEVQPIRDVQGRFTHYMAIQQDITARRRAELENARLASVIAATPDPVLMARCDEAVVFANPAARWHLGLGPEAPLDGLALGDLFPPAARERLRREAMPAARADGVWRGETSLRGRDGVEVPVAQVITVHRDARGEVEFLSTLMHDLRARKQLEQQLVRGQKLEAMARLAGGVAHDFNNLLTVVHGYCSLLLEQAAPRAPERPLLLEIAGAAERAAGLTRQMLAFSRTQVRTPTRLDLNALVVALRDALGRVLGPGVALALAPGPGPLLVSADPAQLEQVLINLALNARDAMPAGGALKIETAALALDAPASFGGTTLAPGRYVRLALTDTGHGMDEYVQSRLFEPFFTTKQVGKGAGLGLAAAYGVVQQSAGAIAVTSAPGRGTTVEIVLPRAGDPPPAEGRAPTEALQGRETLLLVEDDEGVRRLATQVLRRLGYRVLPAPDAAAALELVERERPQLDLLVTDIVMPGMNGRELAARMRKATPGLRVVFMSGYTDEAVAGEGALLAKPFTPEQLGAAIRRGLAQT